MNQPWPKATNLFTAVLKIHGMFQCYLDTIHEYPEEEQQSAKAEFEDGFRLCEDFINADINVVELLEGLSKSSLKWYIIFLEEFLPKRLLYFVPNE